MYLKSKRLLIILGPTSTGKTDLALYLAQKFGGELISADSRQVYKKLDIGTRKYSGLESRIEKANNYWQIRGIKIHMFDVISLKRQYTVADYIKTASQVINRVWDQCKLPIIVGGTGLYLKALTEGLSNLEVPVDKDLRKLLEKLSKKQLQNKLQEVSQDKWESLNNSDRENPRRLIRAIELTMIKPSSEKKLSTLELAIRNANILKIGLTSSKKVLYQRVDKSVVSRIKQGMIEEAENLYKKGLTLNRMKQLGLEYGVLADYIKGDIKNKKELETILKGKIHNFLRRQLTWFKKEKNIEWFDVSNKNSINKVEELVSIWYDNFDANQN